MGAIGGLLGPLVLGRIASQLSLHWVLATLAAVGLVVAWQARALAEPRPRPAGPPTPAIGSPHEPA
jgi:uncharacterized membrane protein YfcA